MSGAMLIRSIGLGEETSSAWKAQGGWYPRRDRTTEQALDLYIRNGCHHSDEPIINLGNTGFSPNDYQLITKGINPAVLFNAGYNIRPLVRPGTTRAILNELLPPVPRENNAIPKRYWLKAPGSKGKGKTLVAGQKLPPIPKEWDYQAHVVGQEYRVITVDDKVVQVNARYGENGNRSYEWVGVTNAPRPVKQVAKDAARKIKGRNILGWDIIHVPGMKRAFVLEGNSCPGMNEATAKRVMDLIAGRTYEDA